jgi:hypothetical protein
MNFSKQLNTLVIVTFLLLSSAKLFSQCSCPLVSGAGVTTVTGLNNTFPFDGYSGQTLLITSGSKYSGAATLTGGTIINLGEFAPSSASVFTSGTINNCGVINFNFSPWIYNLPGSPLNSLFINNCQAGKINLINNASLFNHGIFKNYGVIDITSGNFGSFNEFNNYATGYIKENGTTDHYFRNDGFFLNDGKIEVLGGAGFKCFGNGNRFNGLVSISYNCEINGILYAGCTFNIGRDFTNYGTIYGPLGAGKWARFNVGAYSWNHGFFNAQYGDGTIGRIDMCDATGVDFDLNSGSIGINVTYCVNNATAGCLPLDPLAVTINPLTICSGSCGTMTAVVTGGKTPYTYLWSNGLGTGSTSSSVCPTTNTPYSVTVTDANGSVVTASTTVTVSSIIADAGPDRNVCTGISINIGGLNTASGGIPAYTYLWSPSTGLSSTTVANPTVNAASLTLNTPRTYTVKVTDSKGCTATDQAVVTLNNNCCDATGVTAGPDQKICKWATAQLNAKGGVVEIPGTIYLWESVPPGGGALSNPNIANPKAMPLVTTNYKVTITRPGCNTPFTDFMTVDVLDKGMPNAGADKTICSGESVMLNATAIPGASFEWAPNNGSLDMPNIANPTAKPATTTTYTVTVTGDNVCPVQNTDEVTVTVTNGPEVTTSGDVVACDNTGVTISASAPGATSFAWSPTDALDTPSMASTLAKPLVTRTYVVTVSDASGCTGTGSVTVYKDDLSLVGVSGDQVSCAGNKVTLTAYGGVAYSWSPDKDLSCNDCNAPVASPISTTTYQVAITTVNGCVITKNVTVVVNGSLAVTVTPDKTICTGEKVPLLATGGKEFNWNPDEGLSCNNCPDPVAEVSETTTYTVTATDGNCSGEATVKITVNPQYSAAITYTSSNCIVNFTATPSGLTSYKWNFGDGTTGMGQTISHTYPKTGTYKVYLTVTGTCGEHKVHEYVSITGCNDTNCE